VINLVNPYRPGRPIEREEDFFGRRELRAWALQQLKGGRRVLVFYGPERIGKTSLLFQLRYALADNFHVAYVELRGLSATTVSGILGHLLAAIVAGLRAEDGSVLPLPPVPESPEQALGVVEKFLYDLAGRLGNRSLVIMLDDLDTLDGQLWPEFVAGLVRLVARVPSLHLIITTTGIEQDKRFYPTLFFETAYQHIGALTTEEANELITAPVEEVLHFDYGVVKRITELTSNHPYYLQLFCYTLFNRCARSGWVNQREIDGVLDELLALPMDSFEAIWKASTPPEQATLSALAALRGTRGVAMRQDVLPILSREVGDVSQDAVFEALESLANRGVLERMGALSYRFHIDLFRRWLNRYALPDKYAQGIHHVKALKAPLPPPPKVLEQEGEPALPLRPKWWWIIPIVAVMIVAILGFALALIGWRRLIAGKVVLPTPTPLPVVTFVTPSPTNTPTPLPTATPTAPIVVARSLPSIVYMAKGVMGDYWQIGVMNSDGSSPTMITATKSDETWPTWSPDGQRIAFVSQRDGNREIYVMNADGSNPVNLTKDPADDWTPAWSPDGQEIAFASRRDTANWELYVVKADGRDVRRLTTDEAGSFSPTWSPDGKRIAFASKQDGNWEIYTIRPDGSEPRRLTDNPASDYSPSWSPRGDLIAFESTRDGHAQLYIMRADGSEQKNVSQSSADDHGPSWLPDGERIVFYSNREGNWDIYIMSILGGDVINLTNTRDINEEGPVWRP
jgi:Tol biopolymer transport system component